jgi:hypothetical protein
MRSGGAVIIVTPDVDVVSPRAELYVMPCSYRSIMPKASGTRQAQTMLL